MVRFHGRVVDPIALWSNYVDFPANFDDKGDEFSPLVKCPNPDHHTEKRHFQVNLKKDLVHCFAHCGISGTYEHAISLIEGTTHREARRRILKHSRVGTLGEAPKSRRRRSEQPQTVLDNSYETFIPKAGLSYLSSRGISDETISRWELGWDSETLRIVIPSKDERGRLKYLIKRATRPKDFPKYLYPDHAPVRDLLFGVCNIDPGMVRSHGLIVVEGSIDTIKNHQDGFQNTGGILGNRLSRKQAQRVMNMRPPRLYCMFDADGAGLDATISVKERVHGIPIFVCRYPKGFHDPAELSREQKLRMLDRAIPYAQFQKKVNLKTRSHERKLTRVG